MSYDISVTAQVATGGETLYHTVYERNFTYNNSGIMYAIGCGRDDLSGKLASEVVERIANGVRLRAEELVRLPSAFSQIYGRRKVG